MTRRNLKYCLLAACCTIVAFSVSCSTQKTKWANVTYHNINCHYNVWWNGNEALKAGIRKLQLAAADDYTQILPIYQLGSKEQAMAVKSDMDRAMEKGLKGIKKHSIYKNGKEWVKYVKNCYILTAYGSFYEKDYAATDNTCRLIMNQYPGTSEADEARILLARSMTLQRQYTDAETALEALARDAESDNLDSKLKGKLYMAMAECCLPQEKYKKSVQYLRLALDEAKDRKTRARLYFIMAQIYQKLDKRVTAARYYEQVLKYKPTYIMEFNARINQAACSDMNHADITALNKNLDRMLRDKKNEEYKDQIYYAKGDMYMGVKDAQKACENYRMAMLHARAKSPMKAKAALRMADVLYDVFENYEMAQSYYDTAMHVITIDYPHYDEIHDRHYLLTSLVDFTRVISRNDSLIHVANMDSTTRINYINQKIEEVKEQEAKTKEKALLRQLEAERQAANKTLEGNWYFYNTRSVQQGKESFTRDWGNRLLEDYWFLSHKEPSMISMMMQGLTTQDDSEEERILDADSLLATQDSLTADSLKRMRELGQYGNPDDPHAIAYYLKGLPTTQAQQDSMLTQVAGCLLGAGYIYNDGIHNTNRAIECYLRMTNDFSDDANIVQAFYQLYLIYSKQGNTPRANYYRDMVLMGFPDSDYANLIRDNEYYKEIIRRNQQAQADYAAVYHNYQRGRYAEVVKGADRALQLYKEEPLMGKYKYWKGMALLRSQQRAAATTIFTGIVTDYADTSKIVELALAQLNIIRRGDSISSNAEEEITSEDEKHAKTRYDSRPARMDDEADSRTGNGEDELPAESMVYRYRENMQHYVIVVINDKKIVATQLQYKIGDFNTENYANAGYRASPLMFTDSSQMVTIHRFNNAQQAFDYSVHLQLPGGPLSQYASKDYVVFAISMQNYTTFYNRKDIPAYTAFYRKYYLETLNK